MNDLAERDAAATELGFATQRLMDLVARLDNDQLARVVADLFDSMTRYLKAQEVLFDGLAGETLGRVSDAP